MRIKRYKTFKGGYRFRNFTGQIENRVVALPVPKRVLVPLRQGFGDEVQPVVRPGDRVKAGQIIGRNDQNVSSPVHATISGYVKELIKKNYFRRNVTFVVIEGDDGEEWEKVEGVPCDKNWNGCTEEEIEKKLYLSGVTGLGKAGIPTRFRSSVISPQDVEFLIVHGIGSEVYNASLKTVLGGRKLFDFVDGMKILKKILPKAKVCLALNNKERKLIEELTKLTSDIPGFELALLESKYPQGYDEMLIPVLLGKPFPYGYSAANIGVISLNVRTVLHVQEAVVESRPLIEMIIGLGGPAFRENLHMKVRVGTPLNEVVENYISSEQKARIIFNSLLTGSELNDYSLPVNRAYSHIIAVPENPVGQLFAFIRPGTHHYSYSSAFLAARHLKKNVDTNLHGEERPCIFCGYCEEICPVRIIPHLLSKMVKRGLVDEKLMRYGIFNCIECNLCSFVCPCKISLSKDIKEGQEKLIMAGCDHSLCILPYFELKGLEEYRGIK